MITKRMEEQKEEDTETEQRSNKNICIDFQILRNRIIYALSARMKRHPFAWNIKWTSKLVSASQPAIQTASQPASHPSLLLRFQNWPQLQKSQSMCTVCVCSARLCRQRQLNFHSIKHLNYKPNLVPNEVQAVSIHIWWCHAFIFLSYSKWQYRILT